MVVIDPGHGGNDPGAVNGNNYEKNFNLKVSKYIYDRLNELGIPTYITRMDDETLERDERINRILSAFGNKSDVIVLSNHINAGGGEGAEIVYALRNNDTLANSILNEIGKAGQRIRKKYQRRLPSDPSKDYYFIQRLSGDTQALLLEYGFIDNINDLKKLQNNLLDYGEAVVKAIANYLNVSYTPPSNIDNNNVYIVQSGDSLYSIARKYNTTVDELKKNNNLSSDLLKIGQKIIVSGTTNNIDDSNTYIVKKGDSLYSIAKKYNITIDEIMSLNNLNSTILQVGDVLYINSNNQDNNNDSNIYIVKKGDNLYSIANNLNTTVDIIKSLNDLSSDLLNVGQKLYVPNNNYNNSVYVVKSGDTLYSIARKYNTTVNEIKRINNLSSELLGIGQVLKIPTMM